MADRLPTLRGFVVGKQLVVFCPYCDAWHIHGWNPDSVAREHRVAHCAASPFGSGGYYVAPFKPEDIASLALTGGPR